MNRDEFINSMKSNMRLMPEYERFKIVKASVESCGVIDKSIIIMEECSELSQATSKMYRGDGDKYDLLEEMADVFICIEFLQTMYDITDYDLLKAVDIKILREAERIKTGKESKNE